MATPVEMVMETDGAAMLSWIFPVEKWEYVCLPLIYCSSQVPGKVKDLSVGKTPRKAQHGSWYIFWVLRAY